MHGDFLHINDLGNEVKNIDMFLEDRQIADIIMVDNNYLTCHKYFNNLVPILSYKNDSVDSACLDKLGSYLVALAKETDVRHKVERDFSTKKILEQSRNYKIE